MSALRDTRSEIASWALVEQTAHIAHGYVCAELEDLEIELWDKMHLELIARGCPDAIADLAWGYVEELFSE